MFHGGMAVLLLIFLVQRLHIIKTQVEFFSSQTRKTRSSGEIIVHSAAFDSKPDQDTLNLLTRF